MCFVENHLLVSVLFKHKQLSSYYQHPVWSDESRVSLSMAHDSPYITCALMKNKWITLKNWPHDKFLSLWIGRKGPAPRSQKYQFIIWDEILMSWTDGGNRIWSLTWWRALSSLSPYDPVSVCVAWLLNDCSHSHWPATPKCVSDCAEPLKPSSQTVLWLPESETSSLEYLTEMSCSACYVLTFMPSSMKHYELNSQCAEVKWKVEKQYKTWPKQELHVKEG